ncbi:hypothetical protein FNV43_RR14740 [Rhamnella rubrinervis]|uniref:Protein kinase domain-containing protein n=1 Tax=Rhamnella rubrinervis TaxID=2594499 RepID=A0A8K0H3H0_9ROSA|nr:hypothetical protein FNV43_RR14740 [Rhamnella rubrinervis]
MMIAKLLATIIVLLIFSSWTTRPTLAVEEEAPIAKPGCQSRCGGVNIPFPFGMGARHCYMDKRFQIVCTNHTNNLQRPFLKRTKLEVLNVSIDQDSVMVRIPKTYSNCKGRHSRIPPQQLKIRDNPFVFSATRNMFVAASCGYVALLTSNSSTDGGLSFGSVVAGCVSTCTKPNLTNIYVSGIMDEVWCQTTNPSNVKLFEISFHDLGIVDRENKCNYAFLVDKNKFKSSYTDFVGFDEVDYVPVTMEWHLNYSEFEIFGQLLRNNSTNYCGTQNFFELDLPATKCDCKSGYRGNPYVLDGCQDINECEELYENNCGSRICVNKIGRFECLEPKSKLFLIASKSLMVELFYGNDNNTKGMEQFTIDDSGAILKNNQISYNVLYIFKMKNPTLPDCTCARACWRKDLAKFDKTRHEDEEIYMSQMMGLKFMEERTCKLRHQMSALMYPEGEDEAYSICKCKCFNVCNGITRPIFHSKYGDAQRPYEMDFTHLWDRLETGFGGRVYNGFELASWIDEDWELFKMWRSNQIIRRYAVFDQVPTLFELDQHLEEQAWILGGDCTIGALGVFVLLAGGAYGLYKAIKNRKDTRRKQKLFKRNGGLLLQKYLSSGEANVKKTRVFNSNELDKATDHFSFNRIVGQGGHCTVYKGMLADGRIVAIKKSKIQDQEKVKKFINEVVILSQFNHRNVVQLLGCCLETEVPLLVYEFIPNGTLFEYLHNQNEEIIPLTWKLRLQIAAEIAGALSYLHSAAPIPIYHRDIKFTNILLDEKYRAKIADFGTSRAVAIDQTHLTTLVYGTLGYLDPEYFQSSQFTEKSDVYSFGVVIVELLTGQRPLSLAAYFIQCMEDNRVLDTIDGRIVGNYRDIMALANLAKRCLNSVGKNRPTMKQVAMELESIQRSLN